MIVPSRGHRTPIGPSPRSLRKPALFCKAALIGQAALFCFAASNADAEESAENKAAARDLATEGIQLAQGGKCEEAIPKLTRAEKLFHAPTILTWIGQCQIELGRYVEGTETLNQVAREQIDDDAPEAFQMAQQKARDLIAQTQPKIAKLTIEVLPNDVQDLTVSVNERPISEAFVGAPKPTDPGTHKVTVSAPGYETLTKEVTLDEGARESLSFDLVAAPNGALGPGAEGDANQTKPDETKSSTNWFGWTTVGVGTALLVGGGVTGYLALSKEGDLNCSKDGTCPSSEEGTLDAARRDAMISSILFGVGGAVTVTGVVLLLTGGSKKDQTARGASVEPTVGVGSLGLRGTF